jgi:hypothetical protein
MLGFLGHLFERCQFPIDARRASGFPTVGQLGEHPACIRQTLSQQIVSKQRFGRSPARRATGGKRRNAREFQFRVRHPPDPVKLNSAIDPPLRPHAVGRCREDRVMKGSEGVLALSQVDVGVA